MVRKELEQKYNEIIGELAKDTLQRKPVNHDLLKIIADIQKNISSLDILDAMNRIRKQENTFNVTLTNETETYEKCIKNSPKIK